MDEEALITLTLTGNADAFSALAERLYPRAVRTAYMICGNYADSEDIAQETLAICYINRSRIKEPKAFNSYMHKTLTRLAWKKCRRSGREYPSDEIPEDSFSPRPSAADSVIKREEREEIYSAVCSLPVKLRTAVVLYYYSELSTRDIAAAMGSPEATVRTRLHSARARLKNALEQDYGYHRREASL